MYQDSFITIDQGKEYQARKESIYDQESFFFSCYRQAADCLIEIVKAGKAFVDSHADMDSNHSSVANAAINKELVGYPNNIIAFCAERGQGKTTAMVSFADALRKISSQDHSDCSHGEKEQFWQNPSIFDGQFVVVDRIDPTTMEDGDSILKTVLSRMFNIFQVEWERYTGAATFNSYNDQEHLQAMRLEILKRFQNCYRSLQVIKGHSHDENTDSLEQMLELGDSANLRGSMYLLTQSFLSFMCSACAKNTCLVIQIDDADFNIERAYSIIDDIRRYLVLPKIVVLLSANMTQLETTVEQHFIAQYAISIKSNGMASVERCHNIAERYIGKVIPAYHRIFLPDLQKFMPSQYEHIQVRYLDSEGKNILEETSSQGTIYYQDQLLRLLYQCTGLILLKPENFLHNLLPSNMRELTHFLAFFSRLDKLNEPNGQGIDYFALVNHFYGKQRLAEGMIDLWRGNLSKMEHYLMELWAPINLRTEGHLLLRSLQSDPDDNKNRHLLRLLPDYYGRERVQSSQINGNVTLNWTVYRDQFKEICRSHGLSIYDTAGPADGSVMEYEHVSYADICEALNVLSSLPESNRHYKLIYAIHLLYTIRLNQLLLDQIELADAPKRPKKNMLALFLADVLFKREDLKEKPLGYALWQYDVRTRDLYKLSRLYQFNQQEISYITTFCRNIDRINHGYVAQPIASLEQIGPMYGDLPIQFNFFYSNLQDFDALMDNSTTAKRSLRSKSRQNRMVGSFALLLNWDVQYEFLRYLRSRRHGSLSILENMQGVYGGQSMQDLLSQISQLTDSPNYKNVFDFYASYSRAEREAFDAVIQCVAPEIKRCMLPRMKRDLDEIQTWLNGIMSSETKRWVFRTVKHSATASFILKLTQLQSAIKPLLYLHEVDLAEKDDLAVEWTLEELQTALRTYASVLKAEMEREGIPYDTEGSGPDQ